MNRKLVPHLWFDKEAREAATFYCSLFSNSRITHVTQLHDTPSGDAEVVNFILAGQPFMAISAGPHFTFNPAISFMVHCHSADEVDRLWQQLSKDCRQVLIPLSSYSWSHRYAWLADKYGLNWQIMLTSSPIRQKIMPDCLFTGPVFGKAGEAMLFYRNVFSSSQQGNVSHYRDMDDSSSYPEAIAYAEFQLENLWMIVMDGPGEHAFTFNESVSFVVNCDTQQEIDTYWQHLSAVPEAEQCGWCKDRYGISWQIVPAVLDEMMAQGSPEQVRRITKAFLNMKKLDMETLKQAYALS
ncbi:MAG: VOC family protein [Thermoflavifilum aggregans]|nr:VOC family protein [Thermoflavifilum aggregans]